MGSPNSKKQRVRESPLLAVSQIDKTLLFCSTTVQMEILVQMGSPNSKKQGVRESPLLAVSQISSTLFILQYNRPNGNIGPNGNPN